MNPQTLEKDLSVPIMVEGRTSGRRIILESEAIRKDLLYGVLIPSLPQMDVKDTAEVIQSYDLIHNTDDRQEFAEQLQILLEAFSQIALFPSEQRGIFRGKNK